MSDYVTKERKSYRRQPRNMNIIIEGPDNVGKSTLITNIKNHFNDVVFQTLHFSNVKISDPEKSLEYTKKMYREMFRIMLKSSYNSFKSGIICDRSHLGEMVYGPIYRNYSGEYVLDIEKEFEKSTPIWDNLFLITSIDKAENLIEREDGLSFSTDLEIKKTEIQNFKTAHEKSAIKHKLLLDISEHNEIQAKEAVVNFIEEAYAKS